MNETFPTIQAWLTSHATRDIPLCQIARALDVRPAAAEDLLKAAPTADALLNLNRLAQYRHLALANRVWPNCTWLAWENRNAEPPVIDLIRRVFGRELLEYVERIFGRDVVLQYWADLKVPSAYEDITLDGDPDPLEDVPEDQIVDNPHLDIEVEVGEMFVFGSPATAACFRWLIENRRNYSHFVDNRTSYTNDPIGVQLAYDLRQSLQEGYWATLPPDTLPAHLAIVQALQVATVPDAYQEGALPLLYTSEVATLPTDLLHIVQVGGDEIWLHGPDALVFDRQPVHVFVLENRTPVRLPPP